MSIQSSDLGYYLATKLGSAGNSLTSTAAASLGKYLSTTGIVSATLNNLFDDISGAENAASDVEYRCLFVRNSHATLTLRSAVMWLLSEVSGGADISIGVDPTAASAVGASAAQAVSIVDEQTAPAGVTFTAPITGPAGIVIGDLLAGQCRGVWVRRTATNSGALAGDGVSFRFEGESDP